MTKKYVQNVILINQLKVMELISIKGMKKQKREAFVRNVVFVLKEKERKLKDLNEMSPIGRGKARTKKK
jgi:hypothetical protein